jgi:hypothetical protein
MTIYIENHMVVHNYLVAWTSNIVANDNQLHGSCKLIKVTNDNFSSTIIKYPIIALI